MIKHMRNEQARIGFLSAVLNLNPADILETKLLNTNLRKLRENEKQGILDFNLFKEDANYYSRFHIREDSRNTLYTDKIGRAHV